MKKYPYHPIANMFPLMGDDGINELAARIKTFGQQQKGIVLDGQLLDGRNRQLACEIAGVQFEVMLWENLSRRDREKGPLDYVFDANHSRRQMTPSQSAMVAADYAEKLSAEWKAPGDEEPADSAKNGATTEEPTKKTKAGKTAAIAAKRVGVSTRQVEKAQAVKRKSPKKAEQVRAGKLSLNKAERDAKKADAKKAEFDSAVLRILKVCGNELATAAKKGTRFKGHKEVAAFAALDDKEMKRAQGLIESGWPLKRAMLYKSKDITPKHKVSDLLDKAASEQGKLDIEVEGWKISVRRKAS